MNTPLKPNLFAATRHMHVRNGLPVPSEVADASVKPIVKFYVSASEMFARAALKRSRPVPEVEPLEPVNFVRPQQSSNFAGFFVEVKSGMSYRLWEQCGEECPPDGVALYTACDVSEKPVEK